jgi:phosphoglycolate phosphatase
VIDDLRKLIPGCLDLASGITLPDAVQSPAGNPIVVVTRKLWMKVIKALARWRWRA